MKDVYLNLIVHSLKCPRYLNTHEVDGYDQSFQPSDLPTLEIYMSHPIISYQSNII